MSFGADSCESMNRVLNGVNIDKSIRRREGWQVGDAVFCQITLYILCYITISKIHHKVMDGRFSSSQRHRLCHRPRSCCCSCAARPHFCVWHCRSYHLAFPSKLGFQSLISHWCGFTPISPIEPTRSLPQPVRQPRPSPTSLFGSSLINSSKTEFILFGTRCNLNETRCRSNGT